MKYIQIRLITLCLILAACTPKHEPENSQTSEIVDTYEVVSPIVKDVTYTKEYVADIQSVRYVEVRSKIKGFIEKNHVDEGQAVKMGQLLFTLSISEFQKELQKADAVYKSAMADLKAAEVELTNVQRLVDKNIVSEAELEVLKAKYNALKAKVEEALANKEQVVLHLSFAHIKAPFDGVINRIPNKVGSLIKEGDMLTTISDNREIFAYFNLSEIDYLSYLAKGGVKNQAVSLKLANNTVYPYQGRIEMIESEFDQETGNIAFRARFPNPDALLKHGAHGKVVVDKEIKNALLIPQKSTFEIQDKLYVFVVDQNNVLKQRAFMPKMRIPDFYVVASGVAQDEKILFEGVESAKDGKKIKPVDIDLAPAMLSDGQASPNPEPSHDQ